MKGRRARGGRRREPATGERGLGVSHRPTQQGKGECAHLGLQAVLDVHGRVVVGHPAGAGDGRDPTCAVRGRGRPTLRLRRFSIFCSREHPNPTAFAPPYSSIALPATDAHQSCATCCHSSSGRKVWRCSTESPITVASSTMRVFSRSSIVRPSACAVAHKMCGCVSWSLPRASTSRYLSRHEGGGMVEGMERGWHA